MASAPYVIYKTQRQRAGCTVAARGQVAIDERAVARQAMTRGCSVKACGHRLMLGRWKRCRRNIASTCLTADGAQLQRIVKQNEALCRRLHEPYVANSVCHDGTAWEAINDGLSYAAKLG